MCKGTIDDYLIKISLPKLIRKVFVSLFAGYNGIKVKLLTLCLKAVKLQVSRFFIFLTAINFQVPSSRLF